VRFAWANIVRWRPYSGRSEKRTKCYTPTSPLSLSVSSEGKVTGEVVPAHAMKVCRGGAQSYLHSFLTFQSLAVTLRTNRFNIKKLYVVRTLRLCVLYGSQNKQQLLPYKTSRDCFYNWSVYSAVRTESLYKTDTLHL
jgi:hypothetical protein